MKRTSQLLSFLAIFMMLFAMAMPANAALQAVGPTDPVTTLPIYYMDTASLALQPCLDQNGFCILGPPFDALTIPTAPITVLGPINDTNFPAEAFYYSAGIIMNMEAGEKVNFAYVLEYAFLAGVVPNTAVTFLRTDLQKMINLASNGTYRVTHPYGVFEFTTDAAGNTAGGGGVAVRQEDGTGTVALYLTPAMKAATSTNIGPFLTRAVGGLILDPVSGHTYIGDAVTPVAVTGSPTGVNSVTITRLSGTPPPGSTGSVWTTNLFTLAGRVFTGQIASQMNIDRVTYARDAASAQIDVFATALPTAFLSISATTGLATSTLTQDVPNSGKYFKDVPVGALPTGVTISNSLDIPTINYPVTLVDEVNITQATYDPASLNLTIKAASRDKVAPLAILTVPALVAPNTLDATGTLVKSLTGTIPPATITVSSSKGGTATIQVSVVTPPPVANNDVAVVGAGSNVVIPVLANDSATAPATLNATTVVASLATRGSVAVDPVTGAVTYTPTGATAGTDSFTYTVTDSNLHVSNIATVTVSILAQTLGTPPVAVNDTATTLTGSAVTINVIGNDTATLPATINPVTLVVAQPALGGGTALANLNGTVTYTAPAVPGTYDFAYTVKDTALLSGTSNPAIVTVTVTSPNVPPVAGNDTAATTVGSPITISVLTNDTSTTSTINPATVVVTQPAPGGGSVLASLNGTVTYTPPAVAGTYTFTYTVKDNFVTPATSNVATVTVTVAGVNVPPVANNDTAAANTGSTVTISVLGNDTSATSIINPATVVVTQPAPGGGTALANLNGTVSYTAPALAGTYSFTYTVQDSTLPTPATSNVATVTVTVVAAVIPPVANNDTAATTTGATVTIPVLTNDTAGTSAINPATVLVTQPALGGGTATANLTGTVSYTAPAVAGTYTFTYTVKDSAITPATSNIATVTVTVTAPAVPPAAGNDPATMIGGTANTIISVLGNDTATAPATINAASVVIVTQPLNGTAVANLNGTVTYTPAVGFIGTNTFTYNVKDSTGLVSNTATVTVTVTAPVAETLAVSISQFTVNGATWRVEGTTTSRVAGETITIFNGPTVAGSPSIGTATVSAGVWKFNLKPGPAPNALLKISIQSSLVPAAKLEGITVVVR